MQACVSGLSRRVYWKSGIRGLAGHSHYHNTKHRKARVDAKRQTTFTKVCRDIYMAIKAGNNNVDASSNARLARALDAAKKANVPKERIERALSRAVHEERNDDTVVYEGVFPGGVGVMVTAVAANRNALAGEMRSLFSRAGGELGKARWMFEERISVIVEVDSGGEMDGQVLEDIALHGMEEGAVDVETTDEGGVEILVSDIKSRERLQEGISWRFGMLSGLKVYGMRSVSSGRTVEVGEDASRKLSKLLAALDEHEHVMQVDHNLGHVYC